MTPDLSPENTFAGGAAQEGPAALPARLPMTSLERALLRLMVSGYDLSDAAPALGLAASDAQMVLGSLQSRAGAATPTRLLVLAVLNAWV